MSELAYSILMIVLIFGLVLGTITASLQFADEFVHDLVIGLAVVCSFFIGNMVAKYVQFW